MYEYTMGFRKYGEQRVLDEHTAVSGPYTVQSFVDHEMNGLVLRVSRHVAANRILERVQEQPVHFPANPWQHLKERFAPAWFTRRWPVRTRTVVVRMHVDVDALYPQVAVPIGNTAGLVRFHEAARFELDWQSPSPYTDIVRNPPVTAVYGQLRQEAAEWEAEARDRGRLMDRWSGRE